MEVQNPLYSKDIFSGEKPKLLWLELWFGGIVVILNLFFLIYILYKIFTTIDYLQNHRHILLEIFILSFLLIFSVLIFVYSFHKWHKWLYNKYIWLIDIRRFLLCLLSLTDFLITLVIGKKLVDKSTLTNFWDAKIEWTVAVAIIIGVIGALWALIAKIDANRAFLQAKDANKQAEKAANTALDAFYAVAGIVTFEDILVADGIRQGVPMIEGLLEAAHEKLILVLGIPAIGYFRKKEIENKEGKKSYTYPLRKNDKAINFCYTLAKFIHDIPKKKDFKLFRLFYFDDETLGNFTKGAIMKGEMNESDKVSLENAYIHLNKMIEETKSRIQNDKIFQCNRYSTELGIRFVIAESKSEDKMTENKALVWVVSDFDHDDPGTFDAAGFTTRDKYIIENLKTLSEGYVMTLPNIVTKIKH